MTNFNGITPKAIELLSENRFNDSKAFYEEHKEELKQLATIPMRQIVLDLAEMMTQLDDKMYTDPVYTVSRIRRDTRRSKSKMMYRENLWLMPRRHKKQYPCAPFFWVPSVFAGVLHHGSWVFLCTSAPSLQRTAQGDFGPPAQVDACSQTGRRRRYALCLL